MSTTVPLFDHAEELPSSFSALSDVLAEAFPTCSVEQKASIAEAHSYVGARRVFSSLCANDRPAMKEHLFALSLEDRGLRFGYAITNAQISAYVDRLNFNQDLVLGCFDGEALIGMCHLAIMSRQGQTGSEKVGEIGISLAPGYRGAHVGSRLLLATFGEALLHEVNVLQLNYLVKNKAMAALVNKFQMTKSVSMGEVVAEMLITRQVVPTIAAISSELAASSATKVPGVPTGRSLWLRYLLPKSVRKLIKLLK